MLVQELAYLIISPASNYDTIQNFIADNIISDSIWIKLFNNLKRNKVLFLVNENLLKIIIDSIGNKKTRGTIEMIITTEKNYAYCKLTKLNNFFMHIYRLLLDAAKNPAVIVKGLHYQKYYNNLYRVSADIDLIVSPEDIYFIHDLLISNDFIYENYIDSVINEKTISRMLEYTSHLLCYTHEKYGSVELHQTKNSIINVAKMYSNSSFNEGKYFFSEIDSFIYCCYHTWHHYPKSSFFQDECKMRNFIDVYYAYKYIKNIDFEIIMERAVELSAYDIVQQMLYATSLLFGPFCDERFISNIKPYPHNWSCEIYESSLKDRVYDFGKEIKRINSLIEETDKNKVIGIHHREAKIEANEVLQPLIINSYIVHSNIAYTDIPFPEDELKVCCFLAYTEEHLITKFEISGMIQRSNKNTFFMGASSFKVELFNLQENKHIFCIIQPNNIGSVNIYGYSTGDYFDYESINDARIIINNDVDNHKCFEVWIPWAYWEIPIINVKNNIWKGDISYFHSIDEDDMMRTSVYSFGSGALSLQPTSLELNKNVLKYFKFYSRDDDEEPTTTNALPPERNVNISGI